jgi:hypothetical protein
MVEADTPAQTFDQTAYKEKSRKLISLVNQLRDAGAQFQLELPCMVVCGNQSAGEIACRRTWQKQAHAGYQEAVSSCTATAPVAAAAPPCWFTCCKLVVAAVVMPLPECGGIATALSAWLAGKSSLLERLCGVRLPRAAGTCTKCPTEVSSAELGSLAQQKKQKRQ